MSRVIQQVYIRIYLLQAVNGDHLSVIYDSGSYYPGREKEIEKEMQERKDRNVVAYGMITLRTDGEKVIIAQKIEAPTRKSEKWDIHELRYDLAGTG